MQETRAGDACLRAFVRTCTEFSRAGLCEASGVEPEESEPCNYYCSRNLFYTSTSMHTPFASSGMFFFQFVACFLLAVSPFHESLSLVLFRWSLRFLDTRHVAFTYVCMYIIGLVSCFVEQHFYFRFPVSSFFSLSFRIKYD